MKNHSPLPRQEDLLVDYAIRLKRHCAGRLALHIRLSGLMPGNRRPQHVGLVAALLEPLVKRYEGQIFRLGNADIVLIGKDMPRGGVEAAVMRIRSMFRDDPFAGEGEDAFHRLYDLKTDYAAFRETAETLKTTCEQLGFVDPAVLTAAARDADAPRACQALTPRALAQLAEALETLDLTTLMRKRYVYAAIGDAPLRAVLCKRHVSPAALQKRLVPDHDILADAWLWGHLAAQIDRRLMASACVIENAGDLPLALDMQPASILSAGFPSFLSELRQRTAKPLLIEVAAQGAFADMAAFGFARNMLHSNGHKIALGGIDPLLFGMLDLTTAGADFYTVRWPGDGRHVLAGEPGAAFERAIRSVGAPHVILADCTDEDSIDWGMKAGIRLFEGPGADRLAVSRRPLAVAG
jgi:hypothetical protein